MGVLVPRISVRKSKVFKSRCEYSRFVFQFKSVSFKVYVTISLLNGDMKPHKFTRIQDNAHKQSRHMHIIATVVI